MLQIPGIFSAKHAIPFTLRSYPVECRASINPKTVAAPHMSNFMSHIPLVGLIEIPPVSKVIPFPTIHGLRTPLSASGLRENRTMHGFLSLPLPTLISPPIPNSLSLSQSYTSTEVFFSLCPLLSSLSVLHRIQNIGWLITKIACQMHPSD